MVKYHRLTLFEREEISRQMASGQNIRAIARNLNRTASTISREIQRSTTIQRDDYRAVSAQRRAYRNRHKPRENRKLNTNIPLRKVVFHYLARKWSPEQIAKRLTFLYPNDMDMRISHETIYSYVYILPRGALKNELAKSLRKRHKNRRQRNKNRKRTHALQDYLSIEERPAEAADRIIPGHWEGDLLVGCGNTSAIGTLVERTTRFIFLVKLKNKDAACVRESFAKEFQHLPKGLKRTLTYDQGQEMAEHKLFTKETDITVYFAHPHSPWERGTNENTNALLRQYFPKGTDFTKISKQRLKYVQDEMNDRPRKTLGFYTPHEKFGELLH